jgi:tetratricopeptide (TPR) repeat protein
MKKISLLFLFCCSVNCFADTPLKVLLEKLKRPSPDTARFSVLMELGQYYQRNDPDSALYFHSQAYTLSQRSNEKTQSAKALKALGNDHYFAERFDSSIVLYRKTIDLLNLIKKDNPSDTVVDRLLPTVLGDLGVSYYHQSDYQSSSEVLEQALLLDEKANNKVLMAGHLGNMANVHSDLGNYPLALKYYFKSLKLNQELGQKKAQANNNCNIGIVYTLLRDYPQALKYYGEAQKLYTELENKKGLALTFGNIGGLYFYQKDYERSLEYHFKSLKINEEIGSKNGMALNYGNIANAYRDLADRKGSSSIPEYENALEYYKRSLAIFEEQGAKAAMAAIINNMSGVYLHIKKYALAEEFAKRSLQIASEINTLEDIKNAHLSLSSIYEATDRTALAFKHYKLFILTRDSLYNEENTRKSIQQEYQFNYQKKFTADSVSFAKEKELRQAQIEKQEAELRNKRNQQYGLIGGLVLILVFLMILYNRFRTTNQQKKVIEEQKKIVEEKQKEVLDSIHYAKRIQSSLLPTEKYIERHLKSK